MTGYAVAAAILAVYLITVSVFARLMLAERRQAARERDLMLNQVMHLAGRTWQPPPAEPAVEREPDPDEGRFTSSPEYLSLIQ